MTDPELLSRPSFEILPTEGAEERTGHLPSDAKITVTCSPGQGIEHTLHFSERLLPRGFRVVPHVAARLVADGAHLEKILRWFDEHCVREIYVIGGDAKEPLVTYASALQMLGPQKASGSGVVR